MGELYAEALVKRKDTLGTIAIRFLLIFGTVACFFLTALSSYMIIVVAILVVLIVYFYPKLSIEYEYVFCDGQLDFDKIMGNSKRKNVMRIDLDQVQIVAIEGSNALDAYKNRTNLKVKNFTSLKPDIKPYIIITQTNEDTVKIIFEPSEKMIECMKQKAPRKVFTY